MAYVYTTKLLLIINMKFQALVCFKASHIDISWISSYLDRQSSAANWKPTNGFGLLNLDGRHCSLITLICLAFPMNHLLLHIALQLNYLFCIWHVYLLSSDIFLLTYRKKKIALQLNYLVEVLGKVGMFALCPFCFFNGLSWSCHVWIPRGKLCGNLLLLIKKNGPNSQMFMNFSVFVG